MSMTTVRQDYIHDNVIINLVWPLNRDIIVIFAIVFTVVWPQPKTERCIPWLFDSLVEQRLYIAMFLLEWRMSSSMQQDDGRVAGLCMGGLSQ